MTTDKPEVHIVGIAIDDNPTYVLDVPTFQGRGAAERRAIWSIVHRDRLDPDRVTVCGPYPDERTCDTCDRITDAGEYPDWVNGQCEVCDPSILDLEENAR